jgi:hypothetical protein
MRGVFWGLFYFAPSTVLTADPPLPIGADFTCSSIAGSHVHA